jgi:hypothetical protein
LSVPVPHFIPFLVAIFLALVIAQLAYWHLVRPVLLLKLRYALFEIRDRLRLMIVNKEIGAKQPAYRILDEFCNSSLSWMHCIGYAVIMMSPTDQSIVLRVKRDFDVIRESEQPLQDIFNDINRINVGLIICNSPAWVPWIVVCLLASFWSQKYREMIDGWKRGAMGMTYETI